MSTEIFNFDKYTIKAVTEGDDILFNANEICDALGFANPRQALDSHVDQDDVQKLDVIDNMGRNQVANFVTEFGVYALILGSTKPEARKFKRWVTHDVLPSIRKRGFYESPEYLAMKDASERAKALEVQTKTLALENKTLAKEVFEVKDRNEYLEGKNVLHIDGHLENTLREELRAERTERQRLEEQMFLDECGSRVSFDVKACVKFVKQRLKAADRHLKDLEKYAKKSEIAGTLSDYTDRIRSELEFYRNW